MKPVNITVTPKKAFVEAIAKIKQKETGKDAATSNPDDKPIILERMK